ncbi:MAG: serine/threonine-protein kinase, partial [Chloroflexota bacterium]
MSLERDEMLGGRYQVEEMVRKGSVSELWTAHDNILKRRIALRIVKEEMLDNQAYLLRFEKDSQIVAGLEHPHIIPMYDYGFHKQRPFQIQRMVGTDSLLMWYFTRPKPISSSTLLRIAQQLGSAIDFVHQRGIVHRAISANTVIMDEESQPYLINFTVAKRLSGEQMPIPDPTRFAVLSPEEKEGAATATGSDIYAFGLLLYSLFTGEREPKYQYNQVVSQVRDFRPDLPIGVDVVISRLLHTDPAQRYQSASDATDDLTTAFYSGQGNIEGTIFISYARKDGD